jgi:hypothetical protein
MAITINQEPNQFSLSQDPLIYSVETDGFIQTAGVKAKRTLVFGDEPNLGDHLRINSNVIGADPYLQLTFVSAVTVSNTGEALRIRPTDATTADWIDEHLIPNFRANSLLDLHYTINRIGDELVIEARQSGVESSFTIFSGVNWDIDDSVNSIGVDAVVVEGFKIRAKLFLETEFGRGVFIESSNFFFTPNIDQSLTVDLGGKADELFGDLGVPSDFGFEGAEIDTKSMRRFYVIFADYFGAEPFIHPGTASDQISLLKGSTRKKHGNISTVDFQSLVDSRQFLTNQTGLVEIPSSIHFGVFHFMQTWNTDLLSENIIVKAKVYYTDGTDSTTGIQSIENSIQGALYRCQYGFSKNGLNTLEPLKTPYKYEIWVESSAIQYSVVKKKTIHIITPSTFLYLVAFRNSFGLFETMVLSGNRSEKIAVSRAVLRVGLAASGELQDSDKLAFNVFTDGAVELSTGPIQHDQMNGVLDLIMSKLHWLFNETNASNPIGVVLAPGEYQMAKRGRDGEHFQSYSLSFLENRRK